MIQSEGERNISLVGHTDQGGRDDGVRVMVNRGHACIGTRVSRGVMDTDVWDSRVGSLLQQERAGIPPIAVAPDQIKAILQADTK